MKRMNLIMGITSILVLAGCSTTKEVTYPDLVPKKDEITLELGEHLEDNLIDYLDVSELSEKEVEQITYNEIDEEEVGEQVITYTLGNKSAEVKVIIEDTTEPEIKNSKTLSIIQGDKVNLKDYFTVTDLSKVTVEYDDSEVDYNTEGIYHITVEATDEYNNTTTEQYPLSIDALELEYQESIEMTLDDIETVLATANTKNSIKYESSDPTTAAVSSKGVISAKAPGEAVVSATVNGVSKECKVTVKDIDITLDKNEITLSPEGSYELKVESSIDYTIIYRTQDKSIATVDNNGKISAVSAGETAIDISVKSKKVSCKVTVEDVSITLSDTEVTLVEGGTKKLSATTNVSNQVSYKSDNSSVATVASDGTITAKSAGTATITATVKDKTAKCTVIVNAITVSISEERMSLTKGSSAQRVATTNSSEGITYKSSNPAVATVDGNGNVKAVAVGEATITATCKGITKSYKVSVSEPKTASTGGSQSTGGSSGGSGGTSAGSSGGSSGGSTGGQVTVKSYSEAGLGPDGKNVYETAQNGGYNYVINTNGRLHRASCSDLRKMKNKNAIFLKGSLSDVRKKYSSGAYPGCQNCNPG